jgi:hypothetical protein
MYIPDIGRFHATDVPGVADAFGASVLRDQGPIGRPGTARPIKASMEKPAYLLVFGLPSPGPGS